LKGEQGVHSCGGAKIDVPSFAAVSSGWPTHRDAVFSAKSNASVAAPARLYVYFDFVNEQAFTFLHGSLDENRNWYRIHANRVLVKGDEKDVSCYNGGRETSTLREAEHGS
jgi:hypothetical protein